MASQRKNRVLVIDSEAASALEFLKAGLLYPVVSLMNKTEVSEVLSTSTVNKKIFPFPFILAPSGKRNEVVLQEMHAGEKLDLICNGELFATLIVEEVFEIDPKERLRHIYGTDDETHPGVRSTSKRLGKYAVCGDYTLAHEIPDLHKEYIKEAIELLNAKNITAIMMAVNPLHRAHEKLI